MAAWVLVPCLAQLRTELNRIAPDRDRTSDGTIGDAAHQDSVSDHNNDETGRVPIRDPDTKPEVHAYDADVDLRESDLTMEKVVQHILGRCRAGVEKRLRYIIFNRRIWSASNGWKQRTYTGSNAHDKHAHFSASYETKHEASEASWRLEDIPVALTDADKKWLTAQIDSAKAAANAIPDKVWDETGDVNVGYMAKDSAGNPRNPSPQKMRDIVRHGSPERHEINDRVDALTAKVDALTAKVDQLLAS